MVAQYVITAVPDPEGTLDEFVRVLKPGGELILVNHIGAESGPRRLFELAFAPFARRLGWRPEFPWDRLVELGRQARRRHARRAPSDAADGALFADPLRQIVIAICRSRRGALLPRKASRRIGREATASNLQRFNHRVRRPNLRMAGDVSLHAHDINIILASLLIAAWRRDRAGPAATCNAAASRPRRRGPHAANCMPQDRPNRATTPDGTTTGQSREPLGDKLAKSDGVLCPPSGVDPDMHAPAPYGRCHAGHPAPRQPRRRPDGQAEIG